MSIPVDADGNPDYTNKKYSHFPQNMYEADTILPLPYFTRDVIDRNKHFEFIMNCTKKQPHSQIPSRWGWGQFPNGYGYGNFNLHWNCATVCDPDPSGYVSEKTQKVIDYFDRSNRYR